MERNDSIRERLLSQLPQTDNVAAYKEEVAVLLAKHKRALFWDGMGSKVVGLVAAVCYSLGLWARHRGLPAADGLFVLAAMSFLAGVVNGARHQISQDQVSLLKEIKQLQVQMLELQAALERKNDE